MILASGKTIYEATPVLAVCPEGISKPQHREGDQNWDQQAYWVEEQIRVQGGGGS